MAKKQLPLGKNRNPNKNSKAPHKTKTKNSPKINAKNPSKITETANGDASREETELAIVPWSSVESENDEVTDTKKKPKSVGKKGEKDDAKSKGKKRSRKGEDELEAEEKTENALYTFPMNRISRMIKRQIPDIKISQEVVFLINRASIIVKIKGNRLIIYLSFIVEFDSLYREHYKAKVLEPICILWICGARYRYYLSRKTEHSLPYENRASQNMECGETALQNDADIAPLGLRRGFLL
ncbi:hypothetical protein C2S52_007222 [Perilla frutescens var. hirtella]|nr:hypothetical protein C2S51_008648 [Perilla frutescens var. frutescens]KAH6787670.1 hypothetical protein C2S52_007222 [Perilla frutescens var. hirtella]